MKKMLSMLMIGSMVCFMGCSAEDSTIPEEPKTSVENTIEENKPEEPVETDKIPEEDLAIIFEGSDYDAIDKLAAKYVMKEIEFDGAIDIVRPVEGMKTRVGMLLRLGDYDPEYVDGITMQVKNIALHDPAINDILLRDGLNVHVKANIFGFDETRGLLNLKIIEMTER